MARILWHGIGPWHKTGYGVQTALFAPRLAALGHQVVIAAMGRKGVDDDPRSAHPDAVDTLRTGTWRGLPVIGPGYSEFGLPAPLDIRGPFGGKEPDLIIILKDPWVLDPGQYRRYKRAVAWTNIDCDPMGTPDRLFFEASGVLPVAVSKFGLSKMRHAGLQDARYIPHAIDLAEWTPGDRGEARELLGLPQDHFLVGINATNVGPRKGWGEQFTAFSRFHARHPSSLLLCHTAPEHPEGINLRELAAAKGIGDAVKFGSQINMDQGQMLNWYRSLNVLLNCSFGEGFGLPIVEALACQIPVIGTDCSAISEKIPFGAGRLVPGQPWWNPVHQADWTIPNIAAI
jgi:glycosyltransferase involved in cell wall biosynthesis